MGSVLNQYLAVLFANLSTFAFSTSVGWIGIALVKYESDECPLPTGPVQTDELGWITSLLEDDLAGKTSKKPQKRYNIDDTYLVLSYIGIGGLIGTATSGWMANSFGRKYSLLSMAIPQIVSYLLIIFAQNVYYLYASRFLSGFAGGAVFVLIPIMVSEIADDRIRGSLGTILVIAFSGGEMVGYITGHFLAYETGAWLCLSFSVLFFVLYSFMPETPYYLMKTDRTEQAEKSLRFYRNLSPSIASPKADPMLQHEFSKLKCAYTEVNSTDPEISTKPSLKISNFMNRPFAICCILMLAHELDGEFAMISYAGVIFSKCSSFFSPGISSIIVTFIQLIGTYVSSLFIDRVGRKILMVLSFGGTAICQAIMATYFYMDKSTDIDVTPYNWLPVVSFSAMIFIIAFGALPIPYVILGEILPDNIRSIGITLVSCISWALIFVVTKIFPALLLLIELHGCIYVFAACCFATVIYVLVAVPETKGRSLDEILVILNVK